MTVLLFSFLMLFFAFLAGILGSLTGLGGGVIITPILVLLFHINIHYAMGASLISVIATSSGTSAAFLKEGYTNLRIGMFLEVGAVVGALLGALLTGVIPVSIIAIIFGCVMLFSAYFTAKRKEEAELPRPSHPWATKLNLDGTYPTREGFKHYTVQRVPQALGLMTIAGALSGLLGIGSGTVKVLAMDQAMRLPYKVSTTTSNFIIGITGATSAGIYFLLGYIDPTLTFPVMLGVVLGSFTGAKILNRARSDVLRIIFSIVIFVIAVQMIIKGIGGFL